MHLSMSTTSRSSFSNVRGRCGLEYMGICIEIRNAPPHIVSFQGSYIASFQGSYIVSFQGSYIASFQGSYFANFQDSYIVSSIHLVGEEHIKTFYITHTFWLGCLNLEHWNPPARAFTYYTRPQVAIKGRECHLLACHEWGGAAPSLPNGPGFQKNVVA